MKKNLTFPFLLIAFCLSLPLFTQCRGGGGKEAPIFLRDSSQITGIWLSRGIEAIWLRNDAKRGWRIAESGEADPARVDALIEVLGALRSGIPLAQATSDSLAKGLMGTGLQIRVEYANYQANSYVLFLNGNDEIHAYSPDVKKGFKTELLGFNPDFIANLSLRASDWHFFSLGVKKPSEIKSITSIHHFQPESSFQLDVGEHYASALRGLDDTSQTIATDTTRVAVFLQAFTTLSSYPLEGAQLDSAKSAINDCPTAWTLQLALRDKTQLEYHITRRPRPLHSEDDGALWDAKDAYLLLPNGQIRRILLAEWAVPLMAKSSLQSGKIKQ